MPYTPPSTNPTPTMVTTGLNAESNFFQISRISCRQRVYDGWMLRTGVNTTVRLLFAKQANGKRILGLSCFTTGFPGSPNGVSPQFSLLNSNPLHTLGVMA